jgi:hypothetical protein
MLSFVCSGGCILLSGGEQRGADVRRFGSAETEVCSALLLLRMSGRSCGDGRDGNCMRHAAVWHVAFDFSSPAGPGIGGSLTSTDTMLTHYFIRR